MTLYPFLSSRNANQLDLPRSRVFKEAADDRNVTYSSLSLFFFPYKSDSFFTDSSNSERRNCFAASLEVKSTVNLTATLLRG